MIMIHPQYLSFSDLVSKKLFRIPEYQRAYSWTSHQRQDLFGDIKKTHSKGEDEAHFMAAVVCLLRRKQILGTDSYEIMEVVDGQQRLTTLVVLLKTIQRTLGDTPPERKLSDELSELLVKSEGDELLLLQTNHDSSHFFSDYLRRGKYPSSSSAKTIADKEVLQAIEDCNEFVNEWRANYGDLLSLAALLKNKLFFLLHQINDEKTVYTVFEVLNSRGLEVSWIDRLKSILMGTAFELENIDNDTLISELHTKWRDIYSTIGLRQGMNAEALRIAATLRMPTEQSRLLSEEASVDHFRTICDSAKQLREVSSWLLEVTKICDQIKSDRRLDAVTKISQARLLAAAIMLRSDASSEQRKEVLTAWEKVSFRIYGLLRKDSRTGVGDYARLAWKVVNTDISFERMLTEIFDIGSAFTIDEAVKSIESQNSYEGWEVELRYLLFRYEEYLSEKMGVKIKNEHWKKIWEVNPSDSIEHISPQSSASYTIKHKLGNLMILPPKLNSQLRDASPKNKTDAYRKTGLLLASEVADLIDKERWSKKTIGLRQSSLVNWIKSEWSDS
jgi:Protein of unknown function DUF262/Protein of unknown function (DUF1524)